MKTNNYILAAALMLVLGAPAKAQTTQTVNPEVERIAKVLKDNKTILNSDLVKGQVKNWLKLHKKDAKAVAGLAQAYFEVRDTANAKKYAEMAINRNKNCGDAYCVLGDIEALGSNDGGNAAMWYQNAKTMEPTNPKGYIKYAGVYRMRSPQEAVNSLEELRKIAPNFPVDAEAGNIYYLSGKPKEALEYFNKVKDPSSLEKNYMSEYAAAAHLAGDYSKSLEICKIGLGKFAGEANFNRLGLYNEVVNKNYDSAINYGLDLIKNGPDSIISAQDYANIGHAYNGQKNYQDAITYFTKSIEKDGENNDMRKFLYTAYSETGDIDNAVKYYKDWLDKNPQKSNNDLSELANIYQTAANKTADSTQKDQYFIKADEVWKEYVETYPQVAEYGIYMRAKINQNRDPKFTIGTAKPFWDELIAKVTAHTEEGANDKAYLKEAYYYMGAYSYTENNVEKGQEFMKKLLEIDPNNATAKQLLGIQ